MGSLAQYVANVIIRARDGPGYPEIIHIPKSLVSIARYRQWREGDGEARRWLYDLVVSLYTHSLGGGVGKDCFLVGFNQIFLLALRWDWVWVQLLSYTANYWSPYDIVYRTMTQRGNPFRAFGLAMDAADTMTATAAAVDMCRSKFPENKLIPVMIGGIMFNSSSFFQMLDVRGRGFSKAGAPRIQGRRGSATWDKVDMAKLAGKPTKVWLAEPTAGLTRGVVCACAYWYLAHGFRGGKCRNQAVVFLTALYVLIEMLEEVYEFNAFRHLHKPALSFLSALRRNFNLGCTKEQMLQELKEKEEEEEGLDDASDVDSDKEK